MNVNKEIFDKAAGTWDEVPERVKMAHDIFTCSKPRHPIIYISYSGLYIEVAQK